MKNKIQELKRLQKEIDEAEKERTRLMQDSFGKDPFCEEFIRMNELYSIVNSNQSKIKQIIEEL
jgi:hypothetical protein